MKKIFYTLVFYFFIINKTLASDAGILSGGGTTAEKLRKGEVNIDDIPNMISGATNILIGVAGTIAVIFIIVGGYKYLFGSLEGNTDKGKDTIYMALVGFAISALAYFIIKFIIDNFI